jgi:hypothetical protein
MASFTRLFIVLLPLIALFPLSAHSQHTCVYCRSVTEEPPDPTATRMACTRDVQQPITCPVTGAMPSCDDTSLFEPVGRDLPDGCDVITTNDLGSPVFRSNECVDNVRFAGQVWGLRAVIIDPACPDPGSIWTECSFSTPLCQVRKGIAASQVQGGFQVAIDNTTAAAAALHGMMAPAPEQEIPAATTGGVIQPAAPAQEMMPPTAPAPEQLPPPTAEVVQPQPIAGIPQTTQQPLPGVVTTTPASGGGLR